MLSASPAASVGSGLKPNLGCEMFNFHQFPSISINVQQNIWRSWQNQSECFQTWNPTVGSEARPGMDQSRCGMLWAVVLSRSAVAPSSRNAKNFENASAPNTAGECIASHNACVASFHSDARDSPAAATRWPAVRKNGTCTWHLRENRETELSASTEVAHGCSDFMFFPCFWDLLGLEQPNDIQRPNPSPGVLNRYPAPPVSCWVSPWNLLASACPSLPILAHPCPSLRTVQGGHPIWSKLIQDATSSEQKPRLQRWEMHKRPLRVQPPLPHRSAQVPFEPVQFCNQHWQTPRNGDCYFQEMAKKSMGLGILNLISFTALPNLHPSPAQASGTPHPLRKLLFGFEGNAKSLQLLQGPAQQPSFLNPSRRSIWMDCIWIREPPLEEDATGTKTWKISDPIAPITGYYRFYSFAIFPFFSFLFLFISFPLCIAVWVATSPLSRTHSMRNCMAWSAATSTDVLTKHSAPTWLFDLEDMSTDSKGYSG